jgi:hypothetical protein
VFLEEVVVVGFEICVCGWSGERLLDDLRGLGRENLGGLADCEVLVS